MASGLSRKVGPLPLWAWVGIAAGAILVGVIIRHRLSATAAGTSVPATTSIPDTTATTGGGSGGGTSGDTSSGVAPASPALPPDVTALLEGSQNALTDALGFTLNTIGAGQQALVEQGSTLGNIASGAVAANTALAGTALANAGASSTPAPAIAYAAPLYSSPTTTSSTLTAQAATSVPYSPQELIKLEEQGAFTPGQVASPAAQRAAGRTAQTALEQIAAGVQLGVDTGPAPIVASSTTASGAAAVKRGQAPVNYQAKRQL